MKLDMHHFTLSSKRWIDRTNRNSKGGKYSIGTSSNDNARKSNGNLKNNGIKKLENIDK